MDSDPGPSTPRNKRSAVALEPKKDKKKWHSKTFCVSWTDDPTFKKWLRADKDPLKAFCKACGKTLSAGKSELIKHASRPGHVKNMTMLSKTAPLSFSKKCNAEENIKIECQKAELRYALLAVENHHSFLSIERSVELAKSVFHDCKLGAAIRIKRTKCVNMINYILAETVKEELNNELNNKYISILVDESTDIANDKNLCILVRYIHEGSLKISLLDLVKIGADGATAENLYNLFLICLKEHQLDFKYVVGYCSDNANVMVGQKNSFASLLLKDNPNIITLGCICHSAHLIASAAAEELPKNVEALLHQIYSYFSRSPKRQSVLEKIQVLMKAERHKLINPSRTRWLALLNAINRILEQWDVLVELFTQAVTEDKNLIASIILNDLKNPFTKAYLQFMRHILPLFNTFNALFQSEKLTIGCLANESMRFIRRLCGNFLKRHTFTDDKLVKINARDPQNLLNYEKLDIGEATENTLKSLDERDVHQFKNRCVMFYQMAVEQSLVRLPFRDGAFKEMEFFQPAVALKHDARPEITHLAIKFSPHIQVENINLEWKSLPIYFSDTEKDDLLKKNEIEFWSYLQTLETFDGNKPFYNIGTLGIIVLSLPHSNAEVERAFSLVTVLKTKSRNRLCNKSLSSLLRVKLDMKTKKTTCLNYPITASHLKRFNSSMYLKKTKEMTDDEVEALSTSDDHDSDFD